MIKAVTFGTLDHISTQYHSEKHHLSLGRLGLRSLNKGAKRVEIGYLTTKKELFVYLLFERFPVWLFSLEAKWCSSLILVGCSSISQLMLLFSSGEQQLLEILLAPFMKRNVLLFMSSIDDVTASGTQEWEVMLVSGRLFEYMVPFLVHFPERKILGVVDSYFGSRLRHGRPVSNDLLAAQHIATASTIRWNRLRHSKLGGSTDFIALFVFSNLEILFPQATDLDRGIRHFFDFGIKPGPPPKDLPETRYGQYYLLDDLLLPGL